MIDDKCGAIDGMRIGRGNRSTVLMSCVAYSLSVKKEAIYKYPSEILAFSEIQDVTVPKTVLFIVTAM
jgi:hypothetical protein